MEYETDPRGFAKRLGEIMPYLEIAVAVDGVTHRPRCDSPSAESLVAGGSFYCPPADIFIKAAEDAGTTVRYIKVMDFVYPARFWDVYRQYFTDELLLSLMFPEEFRRRIGGKAYVWNKWEYRRRLQPDLIREPYVVEWKDVMRFMRWHQDSYGDLFDGDVIFLFEEREMISVFHHEGGFCHLYPGESPFAAPGSLDKWLAAGT